MRTLSKSKILAFRQCPRRLWLEIHRPELREDSAATQAAFFTGHHVGDLARALYDPEGSGVLIDPQTEGFEAAFARSLSLMQGDKPVFEAGFRANGALAFADLMLPSGTKSWCMVEVKSSTSVKDYHRDDVAVQAYVARASGVPLTAVSVACIDSGWTYPGDGDYRGLLKEEDLTEEAFSRTEEVESWIAEAQHIVALPEMPAMSTGEQCGNPYACGFHDWCRQGEPQATHPVTWLPGHWSNALADHVEQNGIIELQDVPDELLNERQLRVKTVTLSNTPHFDHDAASQALADHALPAYFMDFETIQFAVPIWKGTRPYRQIPFQFSMHRLDEHGQLDHQAFLDLSGNDPSRAFAEALIKAGGQQGPVYVYFAGFERSRINDLCERFPDLAEPLQAIVARIVDLLPIARNHYYHPSQQGSWSIKAVLPAMCPDLDYQALDGVQDGGMAMEAYTEAIAPETSAERKVEIERQLLAYCALDTYAMVRLWARFTGNALEQ